MGERRGDFLRFFWVLGMASVFLCFLGIVGMKERGGRKRGRWVGSGLNGFGYFKSFGLLSVGWVKENKWKRVLAAEED